MNLAIIVTFITGINFLLTNVKNTIYSKEWIRRVFILISATIEIIFIFNSYYKFSLEKYYLFLFAFSCLFFTFEIINLNIYFRKNYFVDKEK